MKKSMNLFIAIISILSLVNCEEDHDQNYNDRIVGAWECQCNSVFDTFANGLVFTEQGYCLEALAEEPPLDTSVCTDEWQTTGDNKLILFDSNGNVYREVTIERLTSDMLEIGFNKGESIVIMKFERL
jgi:hypothetical protein